MGEGRRATRKGMGGEGGFPHKSRQQSQRREGAMQPLATSDEGVGIATYFFIAITAFVCSPFSHKLKQRLFRLKLYRRQIG